METEEEDDTNDEDFSMEIRQFSSCSHRFSKVSICIHPFYYLYDNVQDIRVSRMSMVTINPSIGQSLILKSLYENMLSSRQCLALRCNTRHNQWARVAMFLEENPLKCLFCGRKWVKQGCIYCMFYS